VARRTASLTASNRLLAVRLILFGGYVRHCA
jgi:hypothetical protein